MTIATWFLQGIARSRLPLNGGQFRIQCDAHSGQLLLQIVLEVLEPVDSATHG